MIQGSIAWKEQAGLNPSITLAEVDALRVHFVNWEQLLQHCVRKDNIIQMKEHLRYLHVLIAMPAITAKMMEQMSQISNVLPDSIVH